MIIPIQKEGDSFSNSNRTSSSTKYTSRLKKSERITPKVTEVEIVHPSSSKLEQREKSTKTSQTNTIFNPWKHEDDFSALRTFQENRKPWNGDEDIENFLLPSFPSRNLLKQKFDEFTSKVMQPIFKEVPIPIDTFAAESDKYVLKLDVHNFKPEEIEVKVTDDSISISAKHEEKRDESNFNFQEYSRKHTLPQGVKADDIKCSLSADGKLTITAPRKIQPALEQRERSIPIKHVGIPAIRV